MKCVEVIKKDNGGDNMSQIVKSSKGKGILTPGKKDKISHESRSTMFKGRCFRCDNPGHLANNPSYPVIKITCSKCGMKGHYSKVCKSRKTKPGNTNVKEIMYDTEDSESECECGQIIAQVGDKIGRACVGKECRL